MGGEEGKRHGRSHSGKDAGVWYRRSRGEQGIVGGERGKSKLSSIKQGLNHTTNINASTIHSMTNTTKIEALHIPDYLHVHLMEN